VPKILKNSIITASAGRFCYMAAGYKRIRRSLLENEAFCISTSEERAKMLQNLLIFARRIQHKYMLDTSKVFFIQEKSTGHIEVWVD
jgi:hypothetical protein